MERVVPDIQKTSNLVRDISISSTEQRVGVNQINDAIQLLSQISQKNAMRAKELSSVSKKLLAQVDLLEDVVAFFKI